MIDFIYSFRIYLEVETADGVCRCAVVWLVSYSYIQPLQPPYSNKLTELDSETLVGNPLLRYVSP